LPDICLGVLARVYFFAECTAAGNIPEVSRADELQKLVSSTSRIMHGKSVHRMVLQLLTTRQVDKSDCGLDSIRSSLNISRFN
jgi:hypothetical protein